MKRPWLILMVGVWGTAAAEPDASCRRDCDLSRLVQTCRSLEGNEQIKEFHSVIYCRGSRTYWELETNDIFRLGTRFTVHGRVSMKGDRYKVPERMYRVAGNPFDGQCSRYREMNIDLPNTANDIFGCDALEEIAKEGRGAYCRRILENEEGEGDPQPTGRWYSNCPGQAAGETWVNLGADLENTKFTCDGAPDECRGVRVARLTDAKGILPSYQLREGDIIVRIGGQKTPTVAEMNKVLDSFEADAKKRPDMQVLRNGYYQFFQAVTSKPTAESTQ